MARCKGEENRQLPKDVMASSFQFREQTEEGEASVSLFFFLLLYLFVFYLARVSLLHALSRRFLLAGPATLDGSFPLCRL